IHRAIAGSLERFMGILIEHYNGAFPLWLAPVQVKIIPISEKFLPYAKEVCAAFMAADIRAELDESNETLNKKIRVVKTEKIPSWIVVGQKEMEQKMLTLEWRDKSVKKSSTPDEIIKELTKCIADRT
ncbi:MAG: threonyl-tRNA synthetase, partial [Parcubacteria group bacterium Gr01-1014_17]